VTEPPDEWVEAFKGHAEQWDSSFFAPMSISCAETESLLGMRFPRSYLDFVDELRANDVSVGDTVEGFAEDVSPFWPKHLVPFFHDGFGDCHCFDTRSPSPEGEYPIVCWSHELTRDENLAEAEEPPCGSFPDWADFYVHHEIGGEGRAPGSACSIGCLLTILAIALVVFLTVVGVVTVWRWIW